MGALQRKTEAFKEGKQENIRRYGILKRKGEPWNERIHQGSGIWGMDKDMWEGAWEGTTRMKCYENDIKKSYFVS